MRQHGQLQQVLLGTLQPAGRLLQSGCSPLTAWLAPACRCPPGHGDIYCSLLGSGMLDRLVKAGIKYLFVSNSDNLGEARGPLHASVQSTDGHSSFATAQGPCNDQPDTQIALNLLWQVK